MITAYRWLPSPAPAILLSTYGYVCSVLMMIFDVASSTRPRARNQAARPRPGPPGSRRISVVEAKTLDRSSGYRSYEVTRAFWGRNGFIHIDAIDRLAARQPAAIYVAALRLTR